MTSSSPIWIFTTDTQLRVCSWDEHLAQVTHLAIADVSGRSLSEVIPDLEARGLLARFTNVLATGVVETLSPSLHHYLIPCPPLQPSAVFDHMQQRVTIAPLFSQTEMIGTIVTIEDVTARMEQERLSTAALSMAASSTLPAVSAPTQVPSGLQSAIKVLDNENWEVRQAAIHRLAHSQDPQIGNLLMQLFTQHYHNLSILNSVLQLLPQTQVDVVPLLLSCAADPDPELRVYVVKALGEQRNPIVLPALLTALEDPDVNVRFHAIEALGNWRSLEAVEPLMAIIASRDFYLAFPALDALIQIGDPTVVPYLVPLLDDEILAEPVARTLGHLGDANAVIPLLQELLQSRVPVPVITTALVTLSDRYTADYGESRFVADLVRTTIAPAAVQRLVDTLPTVNAEELPALITVLGWLPDPAVSRSLITLLANPDLSKRVATALIEHGSGVVALLLETLTTSEAETQHTIIQVLGKIRDPVAVPALIALLDDESAFKVTIAGALAEIADLRAFEPLLRLLRDPDAIVRQAGIAALIILGHPDLATPVIAMLQDLDPCARESAVRLAGYFSFPEAIPQIVADCQDPDEAVRIAALDVLPYLDQVDPLPPLIQALQEDSAKVRVAAVRALGQIDQSRAMPILLSALSDRDHWVRYYAVKSLGNAQAIAALDPLLALAQQDADFPVRLAAIAALGQLKSPRAIPTLATILETAEADLALVSVALTALGEIDDVAVVPLLAQALRSPHASIRATALTALGQSKGASLISLLQWIAVSDHDATVAQTALQTLTQLATPEAIAALIELTLDPQCRDRATQALGRLPIQALEAIATGLSHPHPEARRAVIHALARLRHPQASEFIRQALHDPEAAVRLTAILALSQLGNRYFRQDFALIAQTEIDPKVRSAAQRALMN